MSVAAGAAGGSSGRAPSRPSSFSRCAAVRGRGCFTPGRGRAFRPSSASGLLRTGGQALVESTRPTARDSGAG